MQKKKEKKKKDPDSSFKYYAEHRHKILEEAKKNYKERPWVYQGRSAKYYKENKDIVLRKAKAKKQGIFKFSPNYKDF